MEAMASRPFKPILLELQPFVIDLLSGSSGASSPLGNTLVTATAVAADVKHHKSLTGSAKHRKKHKKSKVSFVNRSPAYYTLGYF